MKMPESPPSLKGLSASFSPSDLTDETKDLVRKYNERYLHWSELKYHDAGADGRERLWALMKTVRDITATRVGLEGLHLEFNLTVEAQERLHRLDVLLLNEIPREFSNSGFLKRGLSTESVMGESIASSQIEGASTTVRDAMAMLRRGTPPRNRSERMVANNYRAMRFILEHLDEDMTPELIRRIHAEVTNGTLESPSYEGEFRTDDSIAVTDVLTGDVFHEPPAHENVPAMVQSLCGFANERSGGIHPLVKGILLHYSLAYIHPFVDGNGRVSRSLFYWCLLRSGYSAAEHLSISKMIKEHRGRYDEAYLLSETDGNDCTYFVNYNLEMLCESADRFMKDLGRTRERIRGDAEASAVEGLTERQADLSVRLRDGPMDAYEAAAVYGVSYASARRDFLALVEHGIARQARDGHRTVYVRAGTLPLDEESDDRRQERERKRRGLPAPPRFHSRKMAGLPGTATLAFPEGSYLFSSSAE